MILTTEILGKYLGKAASTMLAEMPFRDWTFEKSVENELDEPRIDYVSQQNGLDFICDKNGNVRTIFLYDDERRSLEDGLMDIPFSSTRQQVIQLLGSPSKSGGLINDPILGDFGPWDRFTMSSYSIHVEYGVDVDRVKKITLMRPDIVP